MSTPNLHFGIIAAGEGLRLIEEGINIPKPLVEVNGIPLIKRIIDIAVNYNAASITCIINENSQELEEYLHNNPLSIPFNLIIKSTPSSLHSFQQISRFLETPFLLTTIDSIFQEEELNSFLNYGLTNEEADIVAAVTGFIDDEKPLYVTVGEQSQITSFGSSTDYSDYVTGGLYLFKKNVNDELNSAIDKGMSRLRNFLTYLAAQDFHFYAYMFSKIIDVDHVSDIRKAEDFLINKDI
jgi:NDP-sugar pyrophosphorylase family protein